MVTKHHRAGLTPLRKPKQRPPPALLLLVVALLAPTLLTQSVNKISNYANFENTSVTSSTNGGGKVFIRGSGFDADNYDNLVFIGGHNCVIDNYYTTETLLVCALPESYYAPGTYDISVKVKGVVLTCDGSCNLQVSFSYTPNFHSIYPQSTFPGTKLNIYGVHRADDYAQIQHLKISGRNCLLDDEQVEDTSISFWSFKTISCELPEDVETGDHKFTMVAKIGTGFASTTTSATGFKVGSETETYSVRIHPKITGVTPAEGYLNGQEIEVSGVGFGEDITGMEVKVGGQACTVSAVQDDKITCTYENITESAATKIWEGNAGLTIQTFSVNQSFSDLYNSYSSSDINEAHITSSSVSVSTILSLEDIMNTGSETRRMFGIFTAQASGKHFFYTATEDHNLLKISTNPIDPNADFDEISMMQDLCHSYSYNHYRNFYMDVSTQICSRTLSAGQKYFFVFLFRKYSGSGHFTVAVESPNADTSKPNQVPRVQQIRVDNTPVREIIDVVVNNATGGTYKLFFPQMENVTAQDGTISAVTKYYKKSNEIAWNASSTDFRNAISSPTGWWYLGVTRVSLNTAGTLETDPSLITGYKYTLTFDLHRSLTLVPFIETSELTPGSANVSATITQAASDKVRGNFKIKYGDYTSSSINYNEWSGNVALKLETLENLHGGVTVFESGYNDDGKTWNVVLDSIPGAGEVIEIVEASLTGGVSGSPQLIVNADFRPNKTNTFHMPVPSEFISSFHKNPQVTVTKAGIRGGCPAQNCDFNLITASDTPSIEAFTVTSNPVIITLAADYAAKNGGNLLSDTANLSINFGHAPCTITTVALPTIRCTLPLGATSELGHEAGDNIPRVTVTGKGVLGVTASAVVTLPLVTSVSPADGSEGGGLTITITGTRFANDKSRVSVTIGDNPCVIQSTTINMIVCVTPAKNPSGNNLVKVTVNTKEWLETVGSRVFQYNPGKTPTIISLDKPIASPILKQDLVIMGSNFGTDRTKLKVMLVPVSGSVGLKEQECFLNNTVVTDTAMACTLSGGLSGSYDLKMYRDGYGHAIGNPTTATDFKYEIQLASVNETIGSVEGGHLLTLTGTSFSQNISDNQVIFGSGGSTGTTCVIQTASSTQITCLTPKIEPTPTGPQTVMVLGKLTEESVCTGTCTYEFALASTPEVSNISATSGVAGDEITIIGTKLDPVGGSGRKIFIGDVEVTDKDAGNDTTFAFRVPASSEPQGEISISVDGRGKAKFAVANLFVNTFVVDSMTPTSGSKGGNKFVISGSGFHVDDGLIRVTIGSEACLIEAVTAVQITCWVYTSNFADNSSHTVTVFNITKDSAGTETFLSRTCGTCAYAVSASSPEITALTNASLSDSANVTFTADGTAINTNPGGTEVYLIAADRTKFESLRASGTVTGGSNANDMDLTFANTSQGVYNIAYFIPTVGFAAKSSGAETVTIAASNITQSNTQLSLNGGATFNIAGKGFLPDEFKGLYKVEICNRPCVVQSSSRTLLKCKTPKLNTASIQTALSLDKQSILTPEAVISSNTSGDVPAINDGTPGTGFQAHSSGCHVGYDFGEGLLASVSKLRVFPTINTNEQDMVGSVIEGSNVGGSDQANWTQLVEIDYNFVENWNSYFPPSGTVWNYRFIRIRGSNYCRIGEFEVTGVLLNNIADIDRTNHACDVTVHYEDTLLVTLTGGAVYREDKTPIITSVTPRVGSTAGGENVTIVGTNLDPTGSILIDNVDCAILSGSSSATTIVCNTGSRSVLTPPSFEVYGDSGLAIDRSDAGFVYADRWSDTATWGGESLPREGDLVVVPVGMTLYVDVSPPVLASIIVKGALVFADESDMTFDTHFLMVVDGKLQIGTPENRYQHELVITLHGERESAMFPGFGNKNIMVQGGSIDIHGKHRNHTWTDLDVSAAAGTSTLTLTQQVDWVAGEKLVIAPTSRNRDEVEERTIESITVVNGKSQITLVKPLSYGHFAGVLSYDGRDTDIRAEVGLLTRNVVVQGDENSAKNMYGSHIMLRGKPDSVVGRFSYFETRNAGQAFQMGRYPIHFHMIGNVIGSYIEGCSVHHTFNRATTIHGVHYLQIKNNVYYRHMGHAIFVEDSIESNNLVEDNLVIHVSASTALLFSDLKPAGAWITRPNNFFRRNHIVGSSHFSFWFDLPNNPTGPSATDSICPVGDPLGQFDHNVGHSSGIGLRIYPQYKPRTNPCGSLKNMSLEDPFEENEPVPAIFKHNTMYSNGNGIFHRNIGAIQHIDLRLFGNGTGIVISEPDNARDSEPKIEGSLIVGSSALTDFHGTSNGSIMETARRDGFLLKDTSIHNFTSGVLFTTCNGCGDSMHRDIGGRRTTFTNLSFHNVSAPGIRYRDAEQDKDIFYDTDGSLISHFTGKQSNGGWITPYNKHLDIPECQKITDTNICDVPCSICDSSVSILRLELEIKNNFSKFDGQSIKLFNVKAHKEASSPITFSPTLTDSSLFGVHTYRNVKETLGFRGYTFNVATGYDYNLHWGTGLDWVEFELRNNLYWKPYSHAMLHFNNTEQRELVESRTSTVLSLAAKAAHSPVIGASNRLSEVMENKFAEVTFADSFGTYFYSNITQTMDVKVDGGTRGYIIPTGVYCRDTCPPPEEGAPIEQRIRQWSNPADWDGQDAATPGSDVEIMSGWNMHVDTTTSIMNKVTVNGRLSFSNMFEKAELKAKVIDVGQFGQFYAGAEDKPFVKEAKITLMGVFSDPTFQVGLMIPPSSKSVIVRGEMKFYGSLPTPVWTFLKSSISPGETVLHVIVPEGITLNWTVGKRIVLGSSSTHYEHQEFGEIQAIDLPTGKITLKDQVKYFHYGAETDLDVAELGKKLDMRAEVGILDRNIVIQGSLEDNWGCTVLVPQYDYLGGAEPVNIQGELILNGILLENCGQRDAEKGAIDMIGLASATNSQSVTNCAIANSAGWGVSVRNSGGVTFSSNIIYNARKFGLFMENVSKSAVIGNLIIGLRERENYANIEMLDLIIGLYFMDTLTLEARDTIIQDNRVSSSPWFSFVAPGYSCTHTGTPNFFNNVAHSSLGGWFPTSFTGGNACQKFSDFSAFKNMEQGFVNRVDGADVRVTKMVLADNNNSIAVNGGSSGGWYQEISLSEMVIFGRALEDCAECYSDDANCAHNGMYSSIFNETPYDFYFEPERLPLHNSTSAMYNQASVNRVSNIHFKNFNEAYECTNKHKAFRVNNFYQDGVPAIYVADVSLTNVDHNSKFFFANHKRHLNPVVFCGKRDCTGIYNTPIFDTTGSFFDKPMHFFGNNKGAGLDGDCDFYDVWNGHACNPEYAQLQMLKPDAGGRDSVISPLTITRNDYSEDFVEEMKFKHEVDSGSKFAALVKLRQEHNIAFKATMPSGIKYRLVTAAVSDYSIIRVYSENPASMYLQDKAGKKVPNFVLEPDEEPNFANKKMDCGANYYLINSRELIFVVTGEKGCEVTVKHANSITLSARMDIAPADFYSSIGVATFEDRVAAMLGISSDRIRIVSIKKGSTIIEMLSEREQAADDETQTDTEIEAELNQIYQKFATELDSGIVDLGAPVLNYEGHLGLNKPTLTTCNTEGKCETVLIGGTSNPTGLTPVVEVTGPDKTSVELTEEQQAIKKKQNIALAISIPLVLLFILVISYSFYVYLKDKRNSDSNISIGTNTVIKSNSENGGIVIEEIEEEKHLKERVPMDKKTQSQLILKVVSEKDEYDYGVDSANSSKPQFFFLGRT